MLKGLQAHFRILKTAKLDAFSAALFALAPAVFASWLALLIPRRKAAELRKSAEERRRKLLAFEQRKTSEFDHRTRQSTLAPKPES
jgi:hypothetical protein